MKFTEEIQGLAVQKRKQLEAALEQDAVGEPVGLSIATAVLISAAASSVGSPLTCALFGPKKEEKDC